MHKLKKSPRSQDIMTETEGLSKTRFFAQPVATVVNLYLCGEIKAAEEYVEWFQLFRAAGENDIIYIRINSEGGDLFAALQLVRAIQESNATIICSVEGICMSAATLVFLSADRFELSDHTMFMFHNYSGGTIGKGGEMYDNIMYERKWSDKFMRSVYDKFLTDAEIKSMLENKDIWMEPEEVFERLNKRGAPDEQPKRRKPAAKPVRKTNVKNARAKK